MNIIIKDTGIGITEFELKKLFKKFSAFKRDDSNLVNIQNGTGLALYLSKKLIKKHGGDIFVNSDGRNKGSTFHIQILSK